MNTARLFVRVVESQDGSWELRRGRDRVAVLRTYDQALSAAFEVGALFAPSAVYVHRANGSVERVADFDEQS
jgi:hypothetical protein